MREAELKCFVFCGYNGKGHELNSIELLLPKRQTEWLRLPLDERLAKMDNVAAVPFQGAVLLFGGNLDAGHYMYVLGEDGRLKQDLSALEAIPGGMSQCPYFLQGARLYTAGPFREETQTSLKYFDGRKWLSLA